MRQEDIIRDEDQLQKVVEHFLHRDAFAFDVETIGEVRDNPHLAPVAWISLACSDRVCVIPLDHPHGDLIEDRMAILKSGQAKLAAGKSRADLKPTDFSKVEHDPIWGSRPEQIERYRAMEILRPLFFGSATKVGHNIKFDLHAVAKYYGGQAPPGPYYDTMLGSWVEDVTRRGSLDLASCYHRETGKRLVKGVGSDISKHPFYTVAEYSWRDSSATWSVYCSLVERHKRDPLLQRLVSLEMQVLAPVMEMENTGVYRDLDRLQEISDELQSSVDEMVEKIRLLAGREINLNSTPQKQELLYGLRENGGFQMKPVKPIPSAEDVPASERTVYQWSVDAQALERLSKHKTKGGMLVRLLLEYSAKTKILGTYITPYLDPKAKRRSSKAVLIDGKVHAQFKQNGAESGRFSSANPNLQNIPARSEDGAKLRETFVPRSGYFLIAADYSQIEPRIIASLSGDLLMIETYRDGGDVYQMVGDRMGVPRSSGKELVLSIAYGVGPATIATKIGCTVSDARDLMGFFDAKFPRIQRHKNRVISLARKNRYSETVMGRRRLLPAFGSGDMGAKSKAERQAYNHLIQGTAADIMKIALVNVWACLPEEARMLLTVHDEIVLETPMDREMVALTVQTVKEEMEGVRMKGIVVPLVADIGVGLSWAAAK